MARPTQRLHKGFGYVGSSMAIAAKRHGAGDDPPDAMATCRQTLALMRACGH
ncbi:MAG: hypothetical protein OXG81_13800 [Acidobacteria bacterium]|nr:hypothetical protein [Acidobacteriota bacterium]MCY3968435.1 hypothetical protein [Acidobacteriota bacterium]